MTSVREIAPGPPKIRIDNGESYWVLDRSEAIKLFSQLRATIGPLTEGDTIPADDFLATRACDYVPRELIVQAAEQFIGSLGTMQRKYFAIALANNSGGNDAIWSLKRAMERVGH